MSPLDFTALFQLPPRICDQSLAFEPPFERLAALFQCNILATVNLSDKSIATIGRIEFRYSIHSLKMTCKFYYPHVFNAEGTVQGI
jgi:hypothetical protein